MQSVATGGIRGEDIMARNEKPVGFINPEHPNRKYYQCYYCGKPFWKKDGFRVLYCCPECQKADQRKKSAERKAKRIKEPYHKVCQWCGADFETTKGQQKYCCKECLYEANKKQHRDEWKKAYIPRVFRCKECGIEFVTECGFPRSVFCSDICANIYMRKQEHKTARHQAFTAECKRKRDRIVGSSKETVEYEKVYERDKGVCQICGLPVSADKFIDESWGGSIDHVIPLSMGGEHTIDNCQLAHRICNSLKCKDGEAYRIDWNQMSASGNHWRLKYERYKALMGTPMGV